MSEAIDELETYLKHNEIRLTRAYASIATTGEITDASGDLTWTDSGGNHTIVFEEIGTAGAGVVATATQLIADII